ncbi:hypothetical protein BGX23_007544 [Mortierella sp. AD031]|nr:hypothetical protein BGX23_007544 [Mortierella sp. AD031]KAG0219118.1 hypothetical protein BGX33_004688 [Mortierella sp. NVP41]
MVYRALQEMALNSANLSSSSLSTAINSPFTSVASSPATSTSSLPFSSPKHLPTHPTTAIHNNNSYNHRHHHAVKLEFEPPTYGSSHSSSLSPPEVNLKKAPRPPNSFIIYRKEQSAKYSKITAAELSKILGEQWANEPAERKAYYAKLAKMAEQEHALKYPEYKFTPAKRGTGKRAKAIQAANHASQKAPSSSSDTSAMPWTYKPSPLSGTSNAAVSPSPPPSFSRSVTPYSSSAPPHSFSKVHGASNSGAFPYITTKNNTQGSTHLARPGAAEYHPIKGGRIAGSSHQSRHTPIQWHMPRLAAAAPTQPSLTKCPATLASSSGPATLSLGSSHFHPQSLDVAVTQSLLSPSELSPQSLLFDPVIPMSWQWTPTGPAPPTQFTSPGFHGHQPQCQVEVPSGLDYFALQESNRPTPFHMSWSSSMTPLSPTRPEDPATISNGVGNVASPYHWGAEATAAATVWSSQVSTANHELIYGPSSSSSSSDLPTPVSPASVPRAPMNIPAAKNNDRHHYHHHHHQQQMMPLSQAAVALGPSMMIEQDMSISPVLSTCSSSYGSMHSSSFGHGSLPPSFLSGELIVSSNGSSKSTSTDAAASYQFSLSELEEQTDLKLMMSSQLSSSQSMAFHPVPVACKTFS